MWHIIKNYWSDQLNMIVNLLLLALMLIFEHTICLFIF